LTFSGQHGIISLKIVLLITAVVRTLNPTGEIYEGYLESKDAKFRKYL
jgi:hypothetical protein